ncbi:MAG: DUF502 domain-containing protein [Gemmobacter sp.]
MKDDLHPRKRGGLLTGVRSSFLTGLVVIAPIWLTIYLIWLVTGWIDGWVMPLIPERWQPSAFFGINVHGLGVIIFLIFTVVVGWVAKGLIGRSLIAWAEGIVDRLPLVRSIYNAVKQIAETVFSQTGTSFDRACLLQYPREGIWAIGFVSTTARGEIARSAGDAGEVLSIFLPTTPNPTSGFLLFVPAKDVVMLDMKVEDAAKLIISAGLVYPNGKDAPPVRPVQPVLPAAAGR